MKWHPRLLIPVLLLWILFPLQAEASFDFSDERFQGDFSTENLDKIIEEYELFDGWYWTTPPYVVQTFHGRQDSPGWTDSAVNSYHRNGYVRGFYGCRWLSNKVIVELPKLGWGECYGFAQFIGYLLSGEVNPHHHWDFFYNFQDSEGLRVGDLLRTEFESKGRKIGHSAIVYSVSEDEILFLQVSGSLYNQISVGAGFLYDRQQSPTTLEELSKIPNIKICRSPLNQ